MPKGRGKGGKSRRRHKSKSSERELILKVEGQEYATVVRLLGNGKMTAFCYDGVTRECRMRGKLCKRVWINTGDTILISLRKFQVEKADIIYKYKPEEVLIIKQILEISHARPLVFGYLRMQQQFLPFKENVFYTIPDLVVHNCLEIYLSLFFDRFDNNKP